MQYCDPHQIVEDFFLARCVSPCSVCVAVSGGGDSTALLHLLADLRERLSISRLGVAHVNYHIRQPASDEDAAFVKILAKNVGAAFHLRNMHPKNLPGHGVEEWARDSRYAFFSAIKRKFGYTYVATAHTENDQAETVMLRLLRGSGVVGLCGIAPVRDDGVIRPLLCAGGDELRAWLSSLSLRFCEDETNANVSYTRNWVRHAVIPLLKQREPAAIRHIAAAAGNARSVLDVVEPLVNKWIDNNVVSSSEGFFSVRKEGIAHDPVARESLARLLARAGTGFTRQHLFEMLKNAERGSGVFLLPGKWKYECKKHSLDFSRNKPASVIRRFSCRLKVGKEILCEQKQCVFKLRLFQREKSSLLSFADPMTALLDAAKCRGRLVFRSIRKEDRFWPYGSKGFVGCLEFLKKQGVDAGQRKISGVVARDSGEILWVVGLRTGHQFRVTAETKDLLQISCKPSG